MRLHNIISWVLILFLLTPASLAQIPEGALFSDLEKMGVDRQSMDQGGGRSDTLLPPLTISPNETLNHIVCPDDAITGNSPDGDSASPSSMDSNYKLYQHFADAPGGIIQGVSFWAVLAYYFGVHWYPCDLSQVDVMVSFYEDDNGSPGEEVFAEMHTVIPTEVPDIPWGQFTVKKYHIDFIDPLLMEEGWFSIQSANSHSCWTLLLSSDSGTGDAGYFFNGQWSARDPRAYCLYDAPVEDDAPFWPTFFSVNVDEEGALTANLQWINPDITYSGDPLDELLEMHITRDEELVHVIENPNAGGAAQYTDQVPADGFYKYKVFGVNSHGEGFPAIAEAYVGHDVPAGPQDVTLAAEGNDGLVSWSPPEEGLNGGYFTTESLNYSVTRMPDSLEVAISVEDTQFLDTNVPDVGNYYYIVTAENHIGFGGQTSSNEALLAADDLLLYEPFDYDLHTLPPGWHVVSDPSSGGFLNWGVNMFGTAGGTPPQMRFNWMPPYVGTSKLVTHNIDITGHDALRLRYKQSLSNAFTGNNSVAVKVLYDVVDEWEVLWQQDITGNIPVSENTLALNVPENASTMQIGWEFQGDSEEINSWDFDDVIVESVANNDLVALSVKGNLTPSVGFPSGYRVLVYNNGLNTQTDYVVRLMKDDGSEIASIDGVELSFGEKELFAFSWIPDEEDLGEHKVYAFVDLPNDQEPGNNYTQNLNITVHPDDVLMKTIGAGQNRLTIPYNFFWDHSLSQTLYYSHELELSSGAITHISYRNSFYMELNNRPIQIWMGETTADNLAAGWVEPEILQMVADKNVDFPVGENDILIELDEVYYYSGGNLVIHSHKSEDFWSAAGHNFYNSIEPGSGRTRRAQRDGVPYDPLNPDVPGHLMNFYPNISVHFSTEPLGVLSGQVESQGLPLEGVMVEVPEMDLSEYTDSGGNYHFSHFPEGTHTIRFSKHGYETVYIDDVIINEGEETQLDVEMFSLDAYPVTFTVNDQTESHSDLLIKGEMTQPPWINVPLEHTGGHLWSATLDVMPGTYDWGIIADDGTEDGQWLLPDGSYLSFTLDEHGHVSGDVSYNLTPTGIAGLSSDWLTIFPNPASRSVTIQSEVKIYQVKIFDTHGRLVYNNVSCRCYEESIRLESFRNGLYVLQVHTSNGVARKTLQINTVF